MTPSEGAPVLLALCLLFLAVGAGLWWWGARRGRETKNPAFRVEYSAPIAPEVPQVPRCEECGVPFTAAPAIAPIVCGLCGGLELARAPGSRCAHCGGRYRREEGWERGGSAWLAAVRPHLASSEHKAAARGTSDVDSQIRAMLAGGASYREIEKRLAVGRHRISKVRRQSGSS